MIYSERRVAQRWRKGRSATASKVRVLRHCATCATVAQVVVGANGPGRCSAINPKGKGPDRQSSCCWPLTAYALARSRNCGWMILNGRGKEPLWRLWLQKLPARIQ